MLKLSPRAAGFGTKQLLVCPLRPDRVATTEVERSTADTARIAPDLRTRGQGGHDKPVPELIVPCEASAE